jgi:hypothetical protein
MPSGNGHVESAVAFEDAVRLHFQNVIGHSLWRFRKDVAAEMLRDERSARLAGRSA